MRRSTLLTLAALGGLVCLIGGTGLFAALSDTARSGTNSVESAPLAGSADIQIATATMSPIAGETVACGQFAENLTTAFYTVQNVSPGYNPPGVFYCVQNVGSQNVSLSVMADELADFETGCTGDEELHGDTTCGAGLPGELSSVLELHYTRLISCGPNDWNAPLGTTLDANATTPVNLGTLDPGLGQCFLINLSYPGGAGPAIQRSQTDRATWRFKWTATAQG